MGQLDLQRKQGRPAGAALPSKGLGAIPKTRAAISKTAPSSPTLSVATSSSKARRSVEKMARLLEGRGKLASLPSYSLRHLVAKLRARLGGLSDLSLGFVEQEVARMAVEEAE